MLLSSTRSPVFLVSTTQWLPMVYNKKRVIIVALIFASAWAWMASLYFTITFHNQKRRSKLQNAPTWANTTPIVIMAPVKNQTEINDTDDSDIDETLHQLIDFKDLGRNKRAVLLLIIVSTAPARFKRTQLIRKTGWKHCSGNQAQVGRQDKFLIACYLTISRILYFQLFIAKFSTDDDDYNKQKSTGLNKLAKQQLQFARASRLVFVLSLLSFNNLDVKNLIWRFTPRTWTKDTDSELAYSPFGINLQKNSPKFDN